MEEKDLEKELARIEDEADAEVTIDKPKEEKGKVDTGDYWD